MPAIAQVLAISGRAVITDLVNGKIYSIQVENNFELEDASKLHIGMFLQPALNRTELYEMDAGDYPFTECIEFIKLDHKQGTALMLFQNACSPEFSKEIRTKSGLICEELFKDDNVFSEIKLILIGIPFPKGLDTSDYPPNGRCAELVKELIAQTRP